jgi:hypothetical protein
MTPILCQKWSQFVTAVGSVFGSVTEPVSVPICPDAFWDRIVWTQFATAPGSGLGPPKLSAGPTQMAPQTSEAKSAAIRFTFWSPL